MIRITDDDTTIAYRAWLIAHLSQADQDLGEVAAQLLRLINVDDELFLDVDVEDELERHQWAAVVASMQTAVAFLTHAKAL